MGKTAIIGFGRAGHAAAVSMRDSGYTGEIDVFVSDENGPANPMLTTYYASGKMKREGMFPYGNLDAIAKELALNVYKNVNVTDLDADLRQVSWENQSACYDHIIIATGAKPILPFRGNPMYNHVIAVRTIEDANQMIAALEQTRKVLVVGASMVGIKVIQALTERGVAATLADLGTSVFPTVILPNADQVLKMRILEQGVALKLGISVDVLKEEEKQVVVTFSDGEKDAFDAVFFCIGTRPEVALAKAAGIAVDRGILVDERMRTNKDGVYAVGDCCQTFEWSTNSSRNVGLWANAALQGKVAGQNIAGKPTEYAGNIICNITHFWNTDFVSVGNNQADGEVVTYDSLEGWSIHILHKAGKPQCVNVIDNLKLSGVVKNYMAKKFRAADAQFDVQTKYYIQQYGLPKEIVDALGGNHNDLMECKYHTWCV